MTHPGREPPAAPPPAQEDHHAYVFGACVLDVERGILLRDGREVPLRRQSFEVLHYLVACHGRLVSRDELMQAVWGEVVVTESSLTQCLTELRRAIGDEERSAIRTLPRRGYLFDVTVEVQNDQPDPAAKTLPAARWFGLAFLLAALGVGVWLASRSPPSGPAPTVLPEKSIAVLPFVDMSADGDHGYFADGMTEELINLLAQAPELLLIARTSSFYFKDRPANVMTIGRQLDVNYLLEGSVRNAGDRVRVTAQLVRASDGVHVWSKTFDHELDDVLDVQDAIASAVANELHVELQVKQSRHRPDPTAYQNFMQAHFLYNRRQDGDMELAEKYYRQAVDIDPDFARAWAGLAATYRIWMVEFDLPREVGMPRMRDAVDRALSVGPDVAETQLRAANYYWENEEIERAMEHWNRAVELDPEHPLVLGIQGGRALYNGDLERAIKLNRRMVARDPMSMAARSVLIDVLIASGSHGEVRRLLDEATVLFGRDLSVLKLHEAALAIQDGDYETALVAAESARGGVLRDSLIVMAMFGLGHTGEALETLARLESAPDGESALRASEVHAWKGDLGRAWEWYEIAMQRYLAGPVRTRSDLLQWATTSWQLAPLRADPRWKPMAQAYRRRKLDPPIPVTSPASRITPRY